MRINRENQTRLAISAGIVLGFAAGWLSHGIVDNDNNHNPSTGVHSVVTPAQRASVRRTVEATDRVERVIENFCDKLLGDYTKGVATMTRPGGRKNFGTISENLGTKALLEANFVRGYGWKCDDYISIRTFPNAHARHSFEHAGLKSPNTRHVTMFDPFEYGMPGPYEVTDTKEMTGSESSRTINIDFRPIHLGDVIGNYGDSQLLTPSQLQFISRAASFVDSISGQ